ncbi:hypothetical protein [Streptomyces sp. SID3343]|uniref:hypothetical protein n=1 Tax=Streptomyces sp. SID3343 TaxID=2690260 RepID=UPI00136B1055|nr:hypothetical protein [Streptomyces sp. SID3343]
MTTAQPVRGLADATSGGQVGSTTQSRPAVRGSAGRDALDAYEARLNRHLDEMGCDMEHETIELLSGLLKGR